MKKHFGLAFALLLALALVGSGAKASAASQVTEFDVHVGDAFLQSFFGGTVDNVSQASNGDTIKVIFTGHIDVEDREADGKGSFELRDSSGKLLGSGTFRAKSFISFTDFGTTPGFPPTFHGGTALILVRAIRHPVRNSGEETTKFDATLRVDCALGNSDGTIEGMTFAISGGPNFDTKVDGATVFVATED
jgi:hypothetical protein